MEVQNGPRRNQNIGTLKVSRKMNVEMRIDLDPKAAVAINTMLSDLRARPGVSVCPSDLTSWIVKDFFRASFKSKVGKLESDFVNVKKLFRDSLKNMDDKNLIVSLEEFVKRHRKNSTTKDIVTPASKPASEPV